MSTGRFIEARYGDRVSGYLSHEDLTRCRSRQRQVWQALTHIVGTTLEEPWTEEVHSPRALPAFLGTGRGTGGPNLVWDVGLGTLFSDLSFSMPYAQPQDVMEAIIRRVAAVRCVVAGHVEQASRQVDMAIELLDACPIDRSYQESVDAEDQFEVFLLTEMQERFALAHELAHYLKYVDEPAFDTMAQQISAWIEHSRCSDIEPGVLRAQERTQWQEEAAVLLRKAGLDPWAWYLCGFGPDPVTEATWPTLASDLERADTLFRGSSPSEFEEIVCDLLGALAVMLDAHQRQRGWTAIAGAACSRLALANLQVVLSMDAWVSAGGDEPLADSAATTRQHCLNAFVPVLLPFIMDQTGVASDLQVGDIHTVMHLVEDRFRTRLGPGLSNVNWRETNGGSYHSSDEVLLLATFLPFRPSADHREVNRAAGDYKFPLGNVQASSAIYPLYVAEPAFSEQVNTALRRHQRGDWGEVVKEDWDKNDKGLFEEFQPTTPSQIRQRDKLWSLYRIDGEELLITTTSDRSTTEVLFLREYS